MLDGLVVVDASIGMSGALTGKLLAELGAKVVRVVPPGGDPFQEILPAYEAWQGVKEAVPYGGESALAVLLADADACIVGGDEHPAMTWRLDPIALHRQHQNLVILDISGSPNGSDGVPLAAADLLAQARSGLVWEHFNDRPLMFNMKLPTYGAILQGIILLLVAIYERESTGQGRVVQATFLQGAVAWLGSSWTWAENPEGMMGYLPKDLRFPLLECSDGRWVVYSSGRPGVAAAVDNLLGVTRSPEHEAELKRAEPGETFFGDLASVASKAEDWNAAELLELFIGADVAADYVLGPVECWDDPQVRENGMIKSTESGTEYVGLPIHWQ